jgi:putative ABC transport system permease protein
MWRRLKMLFQRGRFEHELEVEMRLHREMREREEREAGNTPDEARYAAARRFGNELQLREKSREMWGWSWLEGLLRDFRYSARGLRRSPGFTAVSVLTLALGIGANTAIFSVMETALWKPLPFPDSERLTILWRTNKARREVPFSVRDFSELRAIGHSFESVSAFHWPQNRNLTSNGAAERILVVSVTHDFFDTFQVRPKEGRTFLPEEETAGRNRVAIVSERVWESRFGAGAALAGQSIVLDDDTYAIVGIAPAALHFEFMPEAEVIVPLVLNTKTAMGQSGESVMPIARLRLGVSLEAARKEMTALAEKMGREFPAEDGDLGFYLENLREFFNGGNGRSLIFFAGAVGLVLLVACVNVAALSLARMISRQREFSVRAALGAGRGVLARQSLVESALLGLIGGGVGTLVAVWGVGGLARFLPEEYSRRPADMGVDNRVLLFSLIISIVTGLLSGFIPALVATRTDPVQAHSSGSRGASSGVKQQRLRSALVIAEIAVALVLLFGAGLFAESFKRLSNAPLGFDPSGVLAVRMSLRGSRYQQPDQARVFYLELLDRVRAIPGVRDAALASSIPMEGSNETQYSVAGQPARAKGEERRSNVRTVTTDYFRILGIRLLSGREFADGDREKTQRAAIINENFARHIFGKEDPIGRELDLWSPFASGPVRDLIRVQVVGVSETTHVFGPDEIDFDEIFLPSAQQPFKSMYLLAKSDQSSGATVENIRGQVRALDSQLPIYGVATMEERVARSLKGAQFNSFLVGVFAVMAMVLVSVGIFGAVAYFVQQRTKEFGIRVALGATRRRILIHAMGQAATLGIAGLLLGTALSLGLGHFLRSQFYMVPHVHMGLLYGVGINDPATLSAACVLLAGIVCLASFIPARRATKVDPMVALRQE